MAARRTAPAEVEHVVEIENISHNCHEYIRSPKTTRYAMKRLLGFVTAAPLVPEVEGPPNIRPYYFERQTDGAVIITLLNAWYDHVCDFDLVLGDGERLSSKTVHRVTPAGAIEPTGLKVRNIDGSYRFRIVRHNTLPNCDVQVLLIK